MDPFIEVKQELYYHLEYRLWFCSGKFHDIFLYESKVFLERRESKTQ
uniref:Uncharacterized protein n=1 Tax=Chlamydia pneumoniae TaxID=83558 RepID=A0A0F7X0F4_CHLPN|nr:Uncharacterized protein BN1224_DC9_CD_00030 [Chlamydia pneumoniae]